MFARLTTPEIACSAYLTDRSLRSTRREGYSVVEVVVVLAITGFAVCCVLTILPSGRETARLANCQKNLMQIGLAVQLYEQSHHRYPASQSVEPGSSGQSPIQIMLNSLMIADFRDLKSVDKLDLSTGVPRLGTRVPGLICPSDTNAHSEFSSTALSYRANVGDDFAGTNGPFAPNQSVASQSVENADGLSYTAGFAERLVGTGHDDEANQANYRSQSDPITGPCVATNKIGPEWRGDAGHSWADPGWRSAIYSHAIPPNLTTSCISRDGQTAAMTASSAHRGRINVWMLDGSLRGITPSINPAVWQALGGYKIQPPQASSALTVPPIKDQVGPAR